jgi:GNAT superfamily N-acetyltransferase
MKKPVDAPVSLICDWGSSQYNLKAIAGSRTVGRLVASEMAEGQMRLSDMEVKTEIATSDSLTNGLTRWLRGKPVVESFRGRGIGNLMLEHFLAWCWEMNVSEVYGSVVQMDMDETPWLLDWYVRHGFEVRAPGDRCLGNAVHMVVWTNNRVHSSSGGASKGNLK